VCRFVVRKSQNSMDLFMIAMQEKYAETHYHQSPMDVQSEE